MLGESTTIFAFITLYFKQCLSIGSHFSARVVSLFSGHESGKTFFVFGLFLFFNFEDLIDLFLSEISNQNFTPKFFLISCCNVTNMFVGLVLIFVNVTFIEKYLPSSSILSCPLQTSFIFDKSFKFD